jgi:SAM-dependent methyltransferase
MDWRVKAVIQKALSVMPGGQQMNSLLQARLGGLRNFDSTVKSKVMDDWLVLMAHLRELNVGLHDRTLVEIGTGWFPTLPVCFVLAGAARCVTYDVTRWLDWNLTRRMVAALEPHLPAIAKAAQLPDNEVTARWRRLRAADSLAAFQAIAGIDYRAPADAGQSGLDPHSVDIVFSNSVLEHVRPDAIRTLMIEAGRVLRPGGLAVHSVNCGDHYAYFDRKVNQGHYLRFNEAQWRWWNNDLQYQNRLRANDFVEIAEQAGLGIVLNKQKPRAELMKQFDLAHIAREFQHYSQEQLCTTSIDFVAQAPLHAEQPARVSG